MSLNKLDPSKLNSWKELKAQFDKEEFLTIEKLMEESDRLKNFSVEWEDLFLDFTKNRISQSTLNLLIKLCHENASSCLYISFSPLQKCMKIKI